MVLGFTEDYDVSVQRFMRFGVYACAGKALLHLIPSVSGYVRAVQTIRAPEFVEERRLIAPGVLFYCSDRYQLWLMGLQEYPSKKVQFPLTANC